MHDIYKWSKGHEEGPSILDNISTWAYDTAKLLMAEAGLDERKWAARCSKTIQKL